VVAGLVMGKGPSIKFATVTVFSNPHVQVQSVDATPAPGGFRVTATGRLR